MISPTDILHGKILIVDDQEANVLLLEQMLRNAGYDSIMATMDPCKVCELHLVNHYDLILLDLLMPGMDGFQVMENLKEIETGSYLPVLVITAQPDQKLRALKSGAKDFVSKPFDLAEVLIRVHNMLEVRLLHLETKKLYDRVVAEQKVDEQRLLKMLPPPFVKRVTERSQNRPEAAADGSAELIRESYAEVSLLFEDIVEFTRFSEGASAQALMGVLQNISTRFDSTSCNAGLQRTNTIGDAYLATLELSDSVAIHTIRASQMALALIEAVDRFNTRGRHKLKISIGIDAGAKGADGAGKCKRKKLCSL